MFIQHLKRKCQKRRTLLFIVLSVLGSLFLNSCREDEEFIPYQTIKINEVFSQLITRDKDDRIYSGQIKSDAGLAEFEKAYGVTLQDHTVDFDKQMFIFGITDRISMRLNTSTSSGRERCRYNSVWIMTSRIRVRRTVTKYKRRRLR